MGQVRRSKGGWSDPAIITESFEHEDKEVLYCPECRKGPYGLKKKLYPRLDYNESDKDLWLQCTTSCGKIFGVNQLKKESKIEGFAVPTNNPFDENRTIVTGLENKRKLTRRQRDLDNHRKYLDTIEDKNEREDKKKLIRFINDSIGNY